MNQQAVIDLTLQALLVAGKLAALPGIATGAAAAVLVAGHGLSRLSMVLVVATSRYARPSGTGGFTAAGVTRKDLGIAGAATPSGQLLESPGTAERSDAVHQGDVGRGGVVALQRSPLVEDLVGTHPASVTRDTAGSSSASLPPRAACASSLALPSAPDVTIDED